MVLEGFIGSMRSGKTLSMTKELYKEYLKGRKIFSNYKLSFEYEPLDINDLDESIRKQDTSKYDGSVIAIDELHVYLDARTSGQKRNRIISYFITQSGKMNCRILWTSQFLRQVELRVRYNSNFLNHCKRFKIVKGRKVYLPQEYKTDKFMIEVKHMVLSEGTGTIGFVPKKTYYIKHPEKMFNLYNTEEKVYYVESREEKEKNDKKVKKWLYSGNGY